MIFQTCKALTSDLFSHHVSSAEGQAGSQASSDDVCRHLRLGPHSQLCAFQLVLGAGLLHPPVRRNPAHSQDHAPLHDPSPHSAQRGCVGRLQRRTGPPVPGLHDGPGTGQPRGSQEHAESQAGEHPTTVQH